jgi:transcriptional regulator GlxA family with amidase domain
MAETRIIAALAYPGVQLLDIVGPLEAFNLAAQQLIDDGQGRDRAYEVRIVGKVRAGVRSMSGVTVTADRDLTDPVADIDTLLLPGALTGDDGFFEDRAYIDWVRGAAPQVRRVCSVCSGALLLAAAGLLNGKRATTHWMDAGELKARFPRVQVESNRIYIEDGGVYTSGGITAGIDLALALIEADHSRQLALKTAKRLLVFLKRPGDQLQFNSLLAAQVQPTRFESLLDWIPQHLDEQLDVATLARRACMSERTFRRRFEADFGLSPRDYVLRARLTKAQSLIESTTLSFGDIARRCGFGSADALRYTFVRALDVTPRDYRNRFGERGAY